jgi:hypothetical protein
MSFVLDSLSQEENLFVLGTFLGASDVDMFKTGIQQFTLDSTPRALSDYPTDSLVFNGVPTLISI